MQSIRHKQEYESLENFVVSSHFKDRCLQALKKEKDVRTIEFSNAITNSRQASGKELLQANPDEDCSLQ